jgi:glycosyltransferase involved in cell wall biosynthesis
MTEKIGLGLVTYNREDYFKRVFEKIPLSKIHELVVVNDGTPYLYKVDVPTIQHENNKGVGVSKNDAFKYLLEKGCDYIFLMEDDILIKDPEVFNAYIRASKESGIQHFNYSQHGLMNKYQNTNTPNPKTKIEYKNNITIDLYMHCVGAFSFYTRKCLEEVGLMDETFYNATEHLEHTFNIINNDMHPPFWWFADIHDSNKYLDDIPWTVSNSTISSNPKHQEIVSKSLDYFKNKHKISLFEINQLGLNQVKQILKDIYKNK